VLLVIIYVLHLSIVIIAFYVLLDHLRIYVFHGSVVFGIVNNAANELFTLANSVDAAFTEFAEICAIQILGGRPNCLGP